MTKKMLVVLLVVLLICSGCAKKVNPDEQTKVVEKFYNAIVTQNRDSIGTIACAEWEKTGTREVDAFMGVKSELKDFSCKVQNATADSAEVVCNGNIAASYGNEITNFPVDGRIHKVVKENGEWRICGY